MHKQLFEWCCFIKPSGRIENPQHAIKVQILSSSMKLSFLLLPLNKKSEPKLSSTTSFCKVRSLPLLGSNGWYVLNIHFSIELVLKLIQFNIHSKLKPKFKTNIHFFLNLEYSFKVIIDFLKSLEYSFKVIIHFLKSLECSLKKSFF